MILTHMKERLVVASSTLPNIFISHLKLCLQAAVRREPFKEKCVQHQHSGFSAQSLILLSFVIPCSVVSLLRCKSILQCSDQARPSNNIWCNYSRAAFPGVEEREHRIFWACSSLFYLFTYLKSDCVKHRTGCREQIGLLRSCSSSLGLPSVLSSVQKAWFSYGLCSAAVSCCLPPPLQLPQGLCNS